MNTRKVALIARWEAAELVRAPYVATWLGAMAVVGYGLGALMVAFGETLMALALFLGIAPIGLAFLTVGGDGPRREEAMQDLLGTYPVTRSERFMGKFLGLTSHALVHLVVALPGLAWLAWTLPGVRAPLAAGFAAYLSLAWALIGVGLVVLARGRRHPIRWMSLLALLLVGATWITLISMSDGVGMHTFLVLFPTVSVGHVLNAYPPLTADGSLALATLVLGASAVVLLAHRFWARARWSAVAAVIVLVATVGSAGAFASTVVADDDFNVTRISGNFHMDVTRPGSTAPLMDEVDTIPIGEPIDVVVRISRPVPFEEDIRFTVHGEHLTVDGGTGSIQAGGDAVDIPATITLEPWLEVEEALYILRVRGETPTETLTAGKFLNGAFPGFFTGYGVASLASLVPFTVAVSRRRGYA